MSDALSPADYFKRYYKPVCRWLNKQNVRGLDIDDLAQEVFVRLLRYPSKDVVENSAGYIFTIASNVAHEWRRLSRNRRAHSAEWLEDLVVEDPVMAELDQESINQYVDVMLDKLPPRQREYLVLHAIDKMTYKEIAKLKSTTYRSVLRQLTKAYSHIRLTASTEILEP